MHINIWRQFNIDWEVSDLTEKGLGFFSFYTREVLVWAGIYIFWELHRCNSKRKDPPPN